MANSTIHCKEQQFSTEPSSNLNRQIHNKTYHTHNRNKDNKRTWATFTYHRPQIREVTNLFRNTKIGIAFKPTTTLQQLIRPTTQNLKTDYEKVPYTKLHARPDTNRNWDKLVLF